MNSNKDVEKVIEAAVVQNLKNVEETLDAQLQNLDKSRTEDDLDAIRRRRLNQLRQEAENKAMWRRNGHGTLQTITEKDFFTRARNKTTPRMVAIFYRKGTSRYANDLIDFVTRLSERHLETLFVSLDAEKCPFLCGRLGIRVLPSIVLVKNGEIDQMLIGLDAISRSGKFSVVGIEKKFFEFDMLTDTNIGDGE